MLSLFLSAVFELDFYPIEILFVLVSFHILLFIPAVLLSFCLRLLHVLGSAVRFWTSPLRSECEVKM